LVERVAVVGAGIAGLSCALALAGRGLEVALFERDLAPPDGAASASEIAQRRRGVPHAVHPHFLMGRLRESLRARHPELLARLAEAGAGDGRFVDSLHPLARAHCAPRAGDAALTSIAARRTTFERVIRDYVAERGLARIESGVEVAGLIVETGSPLRVQGLRVRSRAGGIAESRADVVIDASGRGGALARELEALGARIPEEQHDAGIFYFTRHYELQPGRAYPFSHGLPGLIFPDFIVGALPADGGAFTVTYQVYRDDPEMIAVVRDAERFHALCMRLPVIARWVDPAQARPTSDIFGFGHMDAFWRSCVVGGEPSVIGLHFVGDTAVRSNPKYGRGCTWSLVGAQLLADALGASTSPHERALRYDAALERELRADWRTMLALDAASRARFEVAVGRRPAALADRAREQFTQLVDEAQVADGDFFRAIWTGYHGLSRMDAWMRSPAAWLRLGRHACLRRRRRALLAERSVRPAREQIIAASRAPLAIAT
jgi:2-polyprenyl-6-methoxyphenol hydroxylase-like FAD-dependent oxidoreductase